MEGESMASRICPPAEELQAFAVGDLPGAAFERIADHVANCEECGALLISLDDYTDELVSELAGLQGPADNDAINVPRELIVAAQSVDVLTMTGSSEISTDAGRRFARLLAEDPCCLLRPVQECVRLSLIAWSVVGRSFPAATQCWVSRQVPLG